MRDVVATPFPAGTATNKEMIQTKINASKIPEHIHSTSKPPHPEQLAALFWRAGFPRNVANSAFLSTTRPVSSGIPPLRCNQHVLTQACCAWMDAWAQHRRLKLRTVHSSAKSASLTILAWQEIHVRTCSTGLSPCFLNLLHTTRRLHALAGA